MEVKMNEYEKEKFSTIKNVEKGELTRCASYFI